MNLEEFVHQIKEQIDIVSYIGSLVSLKKAGRNWVGLCPFHVEKTPSFTVSAEKGIFYCFGCHAGGDLIAFVQQFEHLDFREAVDFLGEKAGLTPLQWGKASTAAMESKSEIQALLQFSQAYYQKKFMSHTNARKYLINRGINDSSIDLFKLGYAPSFDLDFSFLLEQEGYDLKMCSHLGLILRDSQGKWFPYFRDRILFPIYNAQNQLMGFGGRVLADQVQPKYLNSPEHSQFQKGKHLFGLNIAKSKLHGDIPLVIVEGYMDVIALHQHGAANVCASLGTAFSLDQAKLALKYTPRLLFCYDNDNAGIQAALRAIDIVSAARMQCNIVVLPPPYKDPDDYIQQQGLEGWKELCKQALMPWHFVWKYLWGQVNPKDPHAIDQSIHQMLSKVVQEPQMAQIEELLKHMALDTGVSLRILSDRIQRMQKGSWTGSSKKGKTKPRFGAHIPSEDGERIILKSLLENPNPDFHEMILSRIDAEDFASETHQKLFQFLKVEFYKNGYLLNKEILIRLVEEELIRLVSELFLIDDSFFNDTAVLECVLKTEENKTKKRQIAQLSEQIISAEKSGDIELSRNLREELKRIV